MTAVAPTNGRSTGAAAARPVGLDRGLGALTVALGIGPTADPARLARMLGLAGTAGEQAALRADRVRVMLDEGLPTRVGDGAEPLVARGEVLGVRQLGG